MVLAFRVRVPESTSEGYKDNKSVKVTPDVLDPICIAEVDGIGTMARVNVTDPLINVTKVTLDGTSTVPPDGIARYRISLQNKDSAPISGVIVTDTLPEGPQGYDFEYVGVVDGYPEQSEVIGRQVVWRDLTILGDRTLELRFEARATIFHGTYYNDVSAWCPRHQDIEPGNVGAPVSVESDVILYKTVYPTQTVNGKSVVYTITLGNSSNIHLEDVRITDTLPAGFSFGGMLHHDDPLPRRTSPVVVWDLGRVDRDSTEELVFRALIHLVTGTVTFTDTYFNKVEGYSPSALIPGREKGAPVQVAWGEMPTVYLPVVLRN
jgi:uncharacterized repeat protein (TIGR01451 family)